MAQPLLEVKHLKTQFRTKRGTVTAVDDVSFSVNQGDTLGIVGESGCGKSVTSLSILQLLPHAVGSVAGGEILYKGEDIAKKGNKEMCRIRGREISMIFQDSMTSLNPVLTIGRQLEETISVHSSLSKDEIKKQALDILTKVGVSSPEQRLKEFPHQLSGGMRQRVMIAMALSCSPSLLIADEPTTPRVSPYSMEKLTPSRAFTARGSLPLRFLPEKKYFFKFLTSRIVSLPLIPFPP